MFKMPFWLDRFFYFLTFLIQGASFLNPRAYAVMHIKHHRHSDTDHDPHSPSFHKNVFSMMWKTYEEFLYIEKNIENYKVHVKGWPTLDKVADSWVTRIIFGVVYFAIYTQIVTSTWQYALLPLHFIIGPIQGAIVNWCGHKYGYKNFDNKDESYNTLPLDLFLMGELYQNNHHKFPNKINFKTKWHELDLGYLVAIPLFKLGFLKRS